MLPSPRLGYRRLSLPPHNWSSLSPSPPPPILSSSSPEPLLLISSCSKRLPFLPVPPPPQGLSYFSLPEEPLLLPFFFPRVSVNLLFPRGPSSTLSFLPRVSSFSLPTRNSHLINPILLSFQIQYQTQKLSVISVCYHETRYHLRGMGQEHTGCTFWSSISHRAGVPSPNPAVPYFTVPVGAALYPRISVCDPNRFVRAGSTGLAVTAGLCKGTWLLW